MRQPKQLRSEMGWSTETEVHVRGRNLCTEILGKVDLGGMAFLELTGRLPTGQEAEVFNAALVTLVEHGMTPSAMSARLTWLGAPEAMQGAVAAGLNGMGSVFGGGAEASARMLYEALDGKPADADLDAVAAAVVADHAQRRRPVPGLGHPLHRPIDPRTPVLFAIAGRNGMRGRYVALMEKIATAAAARSKRTLPLNATGAIGALILELGLPWQVGRGLAVISRSIGLVGHIMEEMRQPMALELWQRAETEVADASRQSEN
ncbi:MAG: citryl-CoA lyase [Hyphomicrobiaceae bacterium]